MNAGIVLSGLVAAVIVLVMGPFVIPMLHRLKFGQTERECGPETHKAKQGTPTMGGMMTMAALLIASLIFGLKGASFVIPALLVTMAFCLVGFLDDFIKVRLKRNLGLRAYQKIIFQVAISLAIALWAYFNPSIGSGLYIPFTSKVWDIGWFYIPLVMFVVIGTTNAVNLTDGLDGLASSVTYIYGLGMAVIFVLLSGKASLLGATADAFNLQGMAVFSVALVGACLGFIRFNCYPAKVFMGDTGSLALGGAVAMMAITSRTILLLPIMGICFVGSAVSVILQVGSYKLRHGKRIFKMAPLHHHFELSGYCETQIVTMYSLVTAACCAACLLGFLW